ncbi:MAG TPA: arginine deiminase family protein [Anaerolineales bacterium]|nr:arginine deiminase family protein [Anaerolineales bacterium]
MRIAITREVSEAIVDCELTHLERVPIDVQLTRQQHQDYEACLVSHGCTVQRLPAGPDMPDSVFVEDIAVVLDEVAVIARPGAHKRWLETPAVAAALEPYRRVLRIGPPGTLDGGDVLQIGRRLFVGRSSRTNASGIQQLRRLLKPFGYSVEGVLIQGCLHLKSAVTLVAEDTLLINPNWVKPGLFDYRRIIEVHPAEQQAGNALWIGETVIYPNAFPATQARLEKARIRTITLDVSEIAKAEGGVTCCSLIFDG